MDYFKRIKLYVFLKAYQSCKRLSDKLRKLTHDTKQKTVKATEIKKAMLNAHLW